MKLRTTDSSKQIKLLNSATEYWLTMSDGTEIRILRQLALAENHRHLSIVFIGGWGTVVQNWELALNELGQDFDVYYVETREKQSSKLTRDSVNNLDRLSCDIIEVVDYFKISEHRLLLFGSSLGGLIAANTLAEKKLNPVLTIFAGPIERFYLPPISKYLILFTPVAILELARPIIRGWLQLSRSVSKFQLATYLRILDNADPRKWRSVAKHIINNTYWHLYERVHSPSLVISISDNDKFHSGSKAEKIADLIDGCQSISVPTVADIYSKQLAEIIRNHLDSEA